MSELVQRHSEIAGNPSTGAIFRAALALNKVREMMAGFFGSVAGMLKRHNERYHLVKNHVRGIKEIRDRFTLTETGWNS